MSTNLSGTSIADKDQLEGWDRRSRHDVWLIDLCSESEVNKPGGGEVSPNELGGDELLEGREKFYVGGFERRYLLG